jgi:hypothetical protein
VIFIALISDNPDGGESDRCTSDSVQTNPAFSGVPAFVRRRRRDSRCSDHTRTSRTFASRHLPLRSPSIAGVSHLAFNARLSPTVHILAVWWISRLTVQLSIESLPIVYVRKPSVADRRSPISPHPRTHNSDPIRVGHEGKFSSTTGTLGEVNI